MMKNNYAMIRIMFGEMTYEYIEETVTYSGYDLIGKCNNKYYTAWINVKIEYRNSLTAVIKLLSAYLVS